MTNDNSSTPSVPVTGRSAWDFAAEILTTLQRVGPTAIVVAGFLLFGYFFYIEVNKAKLQVDKQLQTELEAAQKQLVTTYEKMGSMSDQLIKNIEKLLELYTKVGEDIEKGRLRLKEVEIIELKALRTEKERLNTEIQLAIGKMQDKIDATYIRLKVAAANAEYALSHISTTYGVQPISKREQDKIAVLVGKLSNDDAGLVKEMQRENEFAADIANITVTELKNLDKTLTSFGVTKSLLKLQLDPTSVTSPDGKSYDIQEIEKVGDTQLLEWFRTKESQ